MEMGMEIETGEMEMGIMEGGVKEDCLKEPNWCNCWWGCWTHPLNNYYRVLCQKMSKENK